MAQSSTKRRNILIASTIIIGLAISSIGAVIIYNQLSTTRISISLSTNRINILQGQNSQIQVKVALSGNPENMTLNSKINSTDIKAEFDPSIGKSSFTSTLIIDVPDYTPTGNYSMSITASDNKEFANTSCVISVLNANVTVSGRIQVAFSGYEEINSLQFQDLQTKAVYTVLFPF